MKINTPDDLEIETYLLHIYQSTVGKASCLPISQFKQPREEGWERERGRERREGLRRRGERKGRREERGREWGREKEWERERAGYIYI